MIFCSVLDRLNPLLEPGGVLPLTECGTPDDDSSSNHRPSASSSHRVIRPHPNFRLFLTADPSCGEVSRAMRNRCLEISMLDVPPAIAVGVGQESAVAASADVCARAVAANEHVADLLSLVRAAGVTDPAEATAAIAVHSALTSRRSRGKGNASSGDGPAVRSLLLWAELVAASRARDSSFEGDGDDHSVFFRCMPLAYPGLSPGVGSAAEVKIAKETLAAFLSKSSLSMIGTTSDTALDFLVPCEWNEFVYDGAASHVEQDLKLLKMISAAGSPNFDGAALGLLSFVVDGLGAESSPSDLRLASEDAELLYSTGDAAASAKVIRDMLAHGAVCFARKTSLGDCYLRSISAARLCPRTSTVTHSFERGALATSVGTAVSAVLSILFDCQAWGEVTTMFSEMASTRAEVLCGGKQSPAIASLGQVVSFAWNRWSSADPRANPDLFRALRKAWGECAMWEPCMLLLELIDASLSRRLPVVLAERAELAEARSRVSSGRVREEGLGWLGVSCLICEGGRDSSRVGGGRAACSETRLARSALAPYILPLLRAVDGLVEGLVCREAAELVIAVGGSDFGRSFLNVVQAVLDARDTLSCLFCSPALSRGDEPGADASAGRQLDTVKEELLFEWDPFLVAWRWLGQAMDSLRTTLSTPSGLEDICKVSSAFATLEAVSARVDSAVLQHAGGAAPTRHTLWKYGPRAAAPSSAEGAMALSRLGRLADEFRVLPVSPQTALATHGVVSLGSLMRDAHPALSVELDTRRELLHALCTLHWAASNEQVDDPSGGNRHVPRDVESSSRDYSLSLAERLPRVFETTLKSARTRFESVYKGTRLGAADQTDGLEHHQDDLEFGEKFDDFDTEAAEAVANATLVVVSGDAAGTTGGDSAAGVCLPGDRVSGNGVLQDWALVQLSPLTEHWIAVEECQILALLADLDLAAALKPPEAVVSGAAKQSSGQANTANLADLMARIARLCSAILATPSMSPSAARPFQTLLWAWGNSDSWRSVHGPLLKRLLPVATESFGRRLWENVVGTPGSFSLQLAPTEMIAKSTSEAASDPRGRYSSTSRVSAHAEAFLGPVQVLTLARSAFLLRLLATATFRSGVVPGGGGTGASDAIDLTLMNASARLAQFRTAVRSVRDLRYGGREGVLSSGALKPLVQLSWAKLCRTLCCFDNLSAKAVAAGSREVFRTFESALLSGCPVMSWNRVECSLRSALESCEDERLVAQADELVVPAVRHLSRAMERLVGPDASGATPRVEASAGLGIALLGCLKLMLLLPSSPVDPGLRPALKKQLLLQRMEGVTAELTARRWSLRLEGGGDVSPEVGWCV